MAINTSREEKVRMIYDSIFNFSSERTLWSLGNHDYDNLNRVEKYTKRPPFYAFAKWPFQFLVLDTQDSLSHIVGDQLNMIKAVTDTMASRPPLSARDRFAKYLIVLHHKLIWLPDHPDWKNRINEVANGNPGNCFHCSNSNNFYVDVYPLLVEVQQKGIQVICIAGDLGFYSKTFEYKTEEGIYFLGSGFDVNDEDNQVLVLTFDESGNKIDWKFVLYSDLKNK